MVHVFFCWAISAEPKLPTSLAPPKELKQKYDDAVRRRRHRLPASKRAVAYLPMSEALLVRLESVEDGAILVSTKITEAQGRLLRKRGVRSVTSADWVGLEAVLNGRHHRRFRLHKKYADKGGAADMAQWMGLEIRLDLARAESDAHLEVVGADLVERENDE